MIPDKRNVENILGLTPTQHGILFHYLYGESSHHYFEQTCLHMRGTFGKETFEKAWRYVVGKNDMLRTSFAWKKIKKPVQIIWRHVEPAILYFDLTGTSEDDQQGQVREILLEDKQKGFDLNVVPLRIAAINLRADHFIMVISAHSILYDGWSFNIILKEFLEAYTKIVGDMPLNMFNKPQFGEYIKYLKTQDTTGQEEYWKAYLKDFQPRENPLKEVAVMNASPGFYAERLKLETQRSEAIDAMARQSGFPVASFFYVAWGILLQKLLHENEVFFGTTFSGRSAALKGIEEIVGNFLNSSPLRCNTSGKDTVLQALRQMAEDMRARQSYEQTSLSRIREYAQVPAQTELFDSLIIFENHPVDKAAMDSECVLRVEGYTFEHASNYPITIFILRSSGSYEVHFVYDGSRFKTAAILKIVGFFDNIVTQMLSDRPVTIREIALTTEQERQRILYGFNDTVYPYRRDIVLKDLLERAGETFRHRVALECNDRQMTYGELHSRANRLAWSLKGMLGEGKRFVGLIVERSPEMVVSVLAVIKAGYAYVPIDPHLPSLRMVSMLNNLSIKCIITTEAYEGIGEEVIKNGASIDTVYSIGRADIVRTAADLSSPMQVDVSKGMDLPTTDRPEDIAYVIFTSGSTGTPKGVVVQNRPVINIIEWVNRALEVTENDKVFCVASLGFDLSVYDIFGVLSTGGTMHIATFEDLVSPDALLTKLVRSGSTIWNSAPAVLQNLLQWNEMLPHALSSEHLRWVMLSGDWISLSLPGMIRKYFNKARLLSLGGATEATIWSNYYFVDKTDPAWNSIPYGKPIQNCTYYILDEHLDPCPTGVVGDLYIGGECLAMGYINDKELTEKKFIPNPFIPNGLMYSTGDLARWYEDGNMELIGRKDNQIKIRGYRIELGEIESHLLKLPGVAQALAIVDAKENNDKFICAYYVAEMELDVNEMKRKLATVLPSYMIPLYILRLDEFPVTRNGKVDRTRLPKAFGGRRSAKLPANPIQSRIITIWSEILCIPEESIDIQSDFFELGGHSLNVTELSSRLCNKYDIDIQLREVFAASTVEAQAHLVAQGLLKDKTGMRLAEEKEYYPLTPSQTRMYAIQEANKDSIAYNIAGAARIRGELDLERIRYVFDRLVQLHESLRTGFRVIDGQFVQVIHPPVPVDIEIIESDQQGLAGIIRKFIRPFDLADTSLFRVGIIHTGAAEHVLIVDMHHIIADGYSLKRLMKDIAALYATGETAAALYQYKDYAEWVNQPVYQGLLEKQKQFWAHALSGKLNRLHLPIDFQRPEEQDFQGSKVYFTIDGEQLDLIKKLATDNQSTLFTVMLSLFNVLLARVCGQEEVILGTPVLGRNHPQLDGVIGMFVNMLVLRSYPSANKTFSQFFRETGAMVKEAFQHDDIPFEYLTRLVSDGQEKGRNPLFDVVIEYDNLGLHQLELPGLEVTVMDDLIQRAKFDLMLEIIELDTRLDCRFEYRVSLFRPATIEWLAEKFISLIQQISDNKDVLIGDVNILDAQYVSETAGAVDLNF